MFWNFKKTENEEIELRIEGDIVDNEYAWIYEWLEEDCASPSAFRKELAEHKNKDITVWINSNGGDVFAGASIYNSLKEHKGKVTVKIDGKAISAASVIAMAGDEIHMSPTAILMIHNPWSYASGDMHDLRKTADILDTVKDTIMNAYQIRTGKTKEEISNLMDDETWMSANVALKNGFVDKILYTDEHLEVNNIKDFEFSNSMILKSNKNALDKILSIENQKKEVEKNKILIELNLL